jgi:hypothetical protein
MTVNLRWAQPNQNRLEHGKMQSSLQKRKASAIDDRANYLLRPSALLIFCAITQAATWALDLKPSFCRMFSRCVSAVLGAMNSL